MRAIKYRWLYLKAATTICSHETVAHTLTQTNTADMLSQETRSSLNLRIKNVLNFLAKFFLLHFLYLQRTHTHCLLMMLLKLVAFIRIQLCVLHFCTLIKALVVRKFHNYLTPSMLPSMGAHCQVFKLDIFFVSRKFIVNQINRSIYYSYDILIIGSPSLAFNSYDLWWGK